jgi:hypothetical protein
MRQNHENALIPESGMNRGIIGFCRFVRNDSTLDPRAGEHYAKGLNPEIVFYRNVDGGSHQRDPQGFTGWSLDGRKQREYRLERFQRDTTTAVVSC